MTYRIGPQHDLPGTVEPPAPRLIERAHDRDLRAAKRPRDVSRAGIRTNEEGRAGE